MIFNEVLGYNNRIEGMNVLEREAVRAVVQKDGKFLMIHTNKGDYKFPGGGVEEGEDHIEAVLRELREETGYCGGSVNEKMGVIVERRPDQYEDNMLFEMTSHYYFCDITGEKVAQQLEQYEADLGFEPVWMTIEEAYVLNKKNLHDLKHDANPWVGREVYVLDELKAHFDSKKEK